MSIFFIVMFTLTMNPKALCHGEMFEDDLEDVADVSVVEQWKNLERNIKNVTRYIADLVLHRVMESGEKLIFSPQCVRNGLHLMQGIRDIEPWALRFVDASGKMLDGLIVGSLSNFGIYDECVEIQVPDRTSPEQLFFRGQYCTVDIRLPLPPKPRFYTIDYVIPELKNFSQGRTSISEGAKFAPFFHFASFQFGVCVPSGCDREDVDQVAKFFFKKIGLNANTTRCEVKEELKFTPLMICVIFVFALLGLISATGTLFEIYSYYTEAKFSSMSMQILLSLSVLSNFRKFWATKSSSVTLRCLNGIRFLTMSWVVLGHTYGHITYQLFIGLEKIGNYIKDFPFQAIANAFLAVDTFFCIGGFLVCYFTVKLAKKENPDFNVKFYILHRLWRILPVYVVVIMSTYLADTIGSGPLWQEMARTQIEACRNNWWANLLFINNFYKAHQMCISHSWYIAVDFQLYIASIVILISLLRNRYLGVFLCLLSIIGSILYSGITTYVNDFPPTMLSTYLDPEQKYEYYAQFYFLPFTHISPYCIGMLSGYLLALKPNLKIPRVWLFMGWMLAFVSAFSSLYGIWEWNKGTDPTLWESILYAALSKTAWAVGIAWMIICCATGHGGVVNQILSWKAFVPLGRLTFLVYLIHPIVHTVFLGNIRTQLQPDHFFAVWIFFGTLCITYMIAIAGAIFVESPMLSLEKVFLKKGSNEPKRTFISHGDNVHNGIFPAQAQSTIAVIFPTNSDKDVHIEKIVTYKL